MVTTPGVECYKQLVGAASAHGELAYVLSLIDSCQSVGQVKALIEARLTDLVEIGKERQAEYRATAWVDEHNT